MYAQFSSAIVQAESDYKAETVRRGLRPSRRRARALVDSETLALSKVHSRQR